MKTENPRLVRSLQTAYSAERAASFAYIGHAASLRDPREIEAVRRIEQDEWDHRREVRAIMDEHGIPVSRWLEWKFWWIGLSCHLIGKFMPHFEKVFSWGVEQSANDVDLEELLGVERAGEYCRKFRATSEVTP